MDAAIRKEIMPLVYLTTERTDKFKTGCISITLCLQLCRKNAARNALLPKVLLRGCGRYPDMQSLSAALDNMYGARVEPLVRKKGEVHCIGLYADFVDDAFVPEGERVLEKVTELVGQILLCPATRAGLLNSDYVKSERENLADRIRARINDKQQYAVSRLKELMCAGEPYSVDTLGERPEDALKLSPITLTKHYREIIETARIEIFYCGSAEPARVETAVTDALEALPRAEGELEQPFTDIKMTTGEVRYFSESLDVTQGKLSVGFRLGEIMKKPDLAVLMVFNALYGGSVTSKLFLNVREKLSLCYYASSHIERHKGLLIVSSGIEKEKYDEALSEILRQLELIRQGEISDEELSNAQKSIMTDLRSVMDSQALLENFYLGQAIDSLTYSPDVLAELVRNVSKADILAVAESIRLDSVYFLKNAERSR